MRDHYFGDNGKDYGTDERGENGQVRIVTSSDEKKQLDQKDPNTKINSEDIKSGIRTNTAVLKEASKMLNDKDASNGGTTETLSIVNNKTGDVVRADTKDASTSDDGSVKTIKINGDVKAGGDYTSVHAHTAGAEGGKAGDALTLGPDDKSTFKNFGMNVIVGPLGSSSSTTGAVFYNTNGVRQVQITNDDLTSILGKLK